MKLPKKDREALRAVLAKLEAARGGLMMACESPKLAAGIDELAHFLVTH